MDLSSDLLFKRGYRLFVDESPLRESIAAGGKSVMIQSTVVK